MRLRSLLLELKISQLEGFFSVNSHEGLILKLEDSLLHESDLDILNNSNIINTGCLLFYLVSNLT